MPTIRGWFDEDRELPWDEYDVALAYNCELGPKYLNFPMAGIVPYTRPTAEEIESVRGHLWIPHIDPECGIGKLNTKGEGTFIIDLPGSFGSYIESLAYENRKKCRYYLRKNADLQVREGKPADMKSVWPDYVERLNELSDKWNLFRYVDEELKNIWDLYTSRHARLLTFELNQEVIAVNVSLWMDGMVYDLAGLRSRRPELKQRGLGIFCTLKNIELAIEEKVEPYNMLVADYEYKRDFGAREVKLPHYIRCSRSFAAHYGIPLDEISELIEDELSAVG